MFTSQLWPLSSYLFCWRGIYLPFKKCVLLRLLLFLKYVIFVCLVIMLLIMYTSFSFTCSNSILSIQEVPHSLLYTSCALPTARMPFIFCTSGFQTVAHLVTQMFLSRNTSVLMQLTTVFVFIFFFFQSLL